VKQPRRDEFDAMLGRVIAALPEKIRALLDEVPVVVDDLPSREVLEEFGMTRDEADELCGLHTGRAFTERSIEHDAELPSEIQLYREGIVAQAGGWDGEDARAKIEEEIRITLLHEIGHQLGLDEDDLERLGYG
jgi:predicted Zn-dependent protease with MMP-like domain